MKLKMKNDVKLIAKELLKAGFDVPDNISAKKASELLHLKGYSVETIVGEEVEMKIISSPDPVDTVDTVDPVEIILDLVYEFGEEQDILVVEEWINKVEKELWLKNGR